MSFVTLLDGWQASPLAAATPVEAARARSDGGSSRRGWRNGTSGTLWRSNFSSITIFVSGNICPWSMNLRSRNESKGQSSFKWSSSSQYKQEEAISPIGSQPGWIPGQFGTILSNKLMPGILLHVSDILLVILCWYRHLLGNLRELCWHPAFFPFNEKNCQCARSNCFHRLW